MSDYTDMIDKARKRMAELFDVPVGDVLVEGTVSQVTLFHLSARVVGISHVVTSGFPVAVLRAEPDGLCPLVILTNPKVAAFERTYLPLKGDPKE